MPKRQKKLTKDELNDIENWSNDRNYTKNLKALDLRIEIKCRSTAQRSVITAIENKVI